MSHSSVTSAAYLRFVVYHVDDGVRCVGDEIAYDVLVAAAGTVMQGSLAGRVDGEKRVALQMEIL